MNPFELIKADKEVIMFENRYVFNARDKDEENAVKKGTILFFAGITG